MPCYPKQAKSNSKIHGQYRSNIVIQYYLAQYILHTTMSNLRGWKCALETVARADGSKV